MYPVFGREDSQKGHFLLFCRFQDRFDVAFGKPLLSTGRISRSCSLTSALRFPWNKCMVYVNGYCLPPKKAPADDNEHAVHSTNSLHCNQSHFGSVFAPAKGPHPTKPLRAQGGAVEVQTWGVCTIIQPLNTMDEQTHVTSSVMHDGLLVIIPRTFFHSRNTNVQKDSKNATGRDNKWWSSLSRQSSHEATGREKGWKRLMMMRVEGWIRAALEGIALR
ncbi:hypothetical protein B0H10DRAFT_1958041 [Mycena sp. CBHHK59/15]|nr:hypothetical protein B0H10DRAFT_1958041 [Mycena sp. CBHHK59/15]